MAQSASSISASSLPRPSSSGAGTALIIDARSARQFRQGHVPGSHSIPAAKLISGELPDSDLILITQRPQQAVDLIDQLHRNGYPRRIQYLEGGVHGWQQQGLPLAGDRLIARREQRAQLRQLGWAPLLLASAVSRLLAPLVLALGLGLRPRTQTRAKV